MKNNQAQSNSKKISNSTAVPVFYEIIVQGQLDPQRSSWFEGMTITHIENGESGLASTLIAGLVIDQPALHGLLIKIRDLNLTLISVQRFNLGTNKLEEVSVIPEVSDDRDDFADTSR